MSEVYVFGGTFDPFHEGHVGVIREVFAEDVAVVVAPALQNPWKNQQPAPFAIRQKMIELVLESEGFKLKTMPLKEKDLAAGGLFLSDFGYVYAVEFVENFKLRFSKPLRWVVGPDTAGQMDKWKDWEKYGVPAYEAKSWADDTHAENVRKGTVPPHPAIRELVLEMGIYPHASW